MTLRIAREVSTPQGKALEPVSEAPTVAQLLDLLDRSETLLRQYMQAQASGERMPRRLPDQGRDVISEIQRVHWVLKG